MKKKATTIKLDNVDYIILIQRKRIKHTYIRVDDKNQINVSTNYYTTLKEIASLIKNNQNKILKLINNKKEQLLPTQMFYLGRIYDYLLYQGSRFSYEINTNVIIFKTQFDLSETFNQFYKQEAHKLLYERLKKCHQKFLAIKTIPLPELKIIRMKRRYGTCYYTKNKICLNSKIIKYDEEIIDYVIYHELCHFIHHNHSKAFYNTLKMVCPNYLTHKNNLNKY